MKSNYVNNLLKGEFSSRGLTDWDKVLHSVMKIMVIYMKYYPIGTVLTLKNGDRPIMIYGRKQIQANNNIIWDYVACLYPEGNIGDEYTFFFQQEEIGKIYHLGLSCKAEDRMLEMLSKA